MPEKQIPVLLNLVLHRPLYIKLGIIFNNSALLYSIHFLYNSYKKKRVFICMGHQWFW